MVDSFSLVELFQLRTSLLEINFSEEKVKLLECILDEKLDVSDSYHLGSASSLLSLRLILGLAHDMVLFRLLSHYLDDFCKRWQEGAFITLL